MISYVYTTHNTEDHVTYLIEEVYVNLVKPLLKCSGILP